MTKLYVWLLALTAALLFAVSSCTKTNTEPDQPATPSATLDKTIATPGEVVTLTTSETLESKASWNVTLGGQQVVLARVSDTQAAFLVPVLPSGAASLDLTAVGVKDAKALTIGQYAPIQDPAPVYAAFKTKLDTAVAQVERLALDTSFPVSAQNLAVFHNLQQSLPAAFAAATPAQKVEAAYFLRHLTFMPLDFTTLAERTTATDDPSGQFMNIGRKFVIQNTLAVAGVAAVVAGATLGSTALVLAGGAFAVYHVIQAIKAEDTLVNRIGVTSSLDDYSNRSANAASGTLQLSNGVPRNIRIQATYRTLQAADAQGGPFLKEMIANVNELKQARARLQTALDQMRPTLAGSATTLALFTDVKAQAATGTRFLPASGLLIGNISAAGISLSSTAQQGDVVTMTATSTTVTAVTPFTFEATYINAPLGVDVRKTFNAEFTPGPMPTTCLTPAQLQLLTGGSSKTWRFVRSSQTSASGVSLDLITETPGVPIRYVFNINGQYSEDAWMYDCINGNPADCHIVPDGTGRTLTGTFCPRVPVANGIKIIDRDRIITVLTATSLETRLTYPGGTYETYNFVSP